MCGKKFPTRDESRDGSPKIKSGEPTRRKISRGTHFWHLKYHSSTSSMRNLEVKIRNFFKLSKFEKSVKSHTKSNDKFVQNKVENTFLLFASDLFRV